jgi:hypothetical protein
VIKRSQAFCAATHSGNYPQTAIWEACADRGCGWYCKVGLPLLGSGVILANGASPHWTCFIRRAFPSLMK